jgi:small-conductance mechanosensitive channel
METNPKVLMQFTSGRLLFVAVLLGLTWLLLKWARTLFDGMARANPRMRFLARQVEPPLRILIWFGALLWSAQMLAPTQDMFLAALGSVAIAIALGAQSLIKNLIGGLVIVADRPYQIGDRVKVGEAYGEIEQIGLRSTKIMTPDDTLVTVPNSEVLDNFTYNANAGAPECLVVTELFLPPGVDPDLAVRIGRDVAVSCPYTHLGRRMAILLTDSYSQTPYVTLKIKAYVYDHRYELAMMSDITRRAKREFIARGLLEGWVAK